MAVKLKITWEVALESFISIKITMAIQLKYNAASERIINLNLFLLDLSLINVQIMVILRFFIQ